jgi:serine phosphatase RsbU (regulator of sigma subunit)
VTQGTEGEQLLLKRPATVGDLQSLSGPTLIAMAISAFVVVTDGALGPAVNLIPLLAVAPVIAALSASEVETGVVGAFCLVMALLSGLWNDGPGGADHLVAILVVAAGTMAGIWTAALRERLERGRAAESMLAEAGTLLEDELDQAKRAQHVSRIAVPQLADLATVDLLQPDGSLHRAATASLDTATADAFRRLRRRQPIDADGPHPIAEVVRTGRERLLDGMSEAEIEEIAKGKAERAALRKVATGEILVVPLRARGSTLGALSLYSRRPDRHYDQDARRVVRSLAERFALSLDNARVHQEQAHIASVLQRSLMPLALPEVDGFETAYRFLAAGEANQVGGDFFDLFRSGEECWTVVIGDVCGKGPEAAALTALARHTIRAAESPADPPREGLSRLHDSIRDNDPEHRFCTAVLARVESPNGRARLRLTIGGHPSPLAVRADGVVEPLGSPGTLLGPLDRLRLEDASTQIRAGESVVLFTDGLLEARDRSNGDDESWPSGMLEGANGHSAEWIAEQLLQGALDRQGGEPRDDIAIVVLRRKP